MALNVVGLVVVIVFYLIVIIIGVLVARRVKVQGDGGHLTEMSMVAGRNLGLGVGIFTMAATSVGGGYLSGTTEGIAVSGIAWTIYPFTIVIAFVLGSLVFAKPMRERAYLTLLDPLQERFGDVMTGMLLLGALFAELLWGASILIALGTSLSVVISLDKHVSIITSAIVATVYTAFGQMVAVAYTDVIQFLLILIGMVVCVPFAMTNENVRDISSTKDQWIGSIDANMAASWADYFISQALGGIPWNTYMMRILSAKSVRHAQIVSVAGGLVGCVMAIPPFLLGAVALSADWNATDYIGDPVEQEPASLLPLVIYHFTPEAVALLALSALVSAVLSSMDSIILSSSSMFTHNIYRLALRKHATEKELRVVQVVSMLCLTTISTVLALSVDTIYGIFILTADIVYIVLFPQLTCAVFLPKTNAYGSAVGLILGLILRFGGGEPSLSLAPFIKYPYYDENIGQLFPYKTFTMLVSLLTLIGVSYLFRLLFKKQLLPASWDVTGKIVLRDANITNVSQDGISNDGYTASNTVTLIKF